MTDVNENKQLLPLVEAPSNVGERQIAKIMKFFFWVWCIISCIAHLPGEIGKQICRGFKCVGNALRTFVKASTTFVGALMNKTKFKSPSENLINLAWKVIVAPVGLHKYVTWRHPQETLTDTGDTMIDILFYGSLGFITWIITAAGLESLHEGQEKLCEGQEKLCEDQKKMREDVEKMRKHQKKMRQHQKKMRKRQKKMRKRQKKMRKSQKEMDKSQQEMGKSQQEMGKGLKEILKRLDRIEKKLRFE